MKVAMIPARLHSTRVPRKNLRFLGGKPLLAWVVETARESGLFDKVYVNSESDEILNLGEELGASSYRRSAELAGDKATTDHFVADFLAAMPEVNRLFQITPTSPFLSAQDMRAAVLALDDADVVVSVRAVQAETMLGETAINFDPALPMLPSQKLEPVEIFCNGIFGWRRGAFEKCGSYGFGSRVRRLRLSGDAAIDIDTEQDFQDAELVLARRRAGAVKPRYWTSTAFSQCDAGKVLDDDGVSANDLAGSVPLVNIPELLKRFPAGQSFGWRVVQSPSNSATIISQLPGEGNRRHYHADWDEWWFILEGEYKFAIEDQTRTVKKGDLVFIERGKWHQITAAGKGRASRLAVSRDGVEHIYRD